MRFLLIPALLLAAAPAHAAQSVSLAPPVGATFLYGSEGPRAVPEGHPLRGRIAVEPVLEMPKRVGGLLSPVTKPAEFDRALRHTLEQARLLAGPSDPPKARLLVTWRWLDAPAKFGTRAHATVEIGYELRRIDSGQTIFQREVRTESRAHGGVASERVRLNARMAVQHNIASAVACLDKAAYGRAPDDCAAWIRFAAE
jgi:hypothetical protein